MQKEVTQREKLWDAGGSSEGVYEGGFATVQCLELAHYAPKSIAEVPLNRIPRTTSQ